MRKNLLLFIVVMFFLTGCGSSKLEEYSVNYKLDISDIFSERIVFALPKNAYKVADKFTDKKNTTYPLEYSLLKQDYYPIFSNKKDVYNKDIKKYNNQVDVILSYNYPEKHFVYANLITLCFEKYDIISGDDYFEVKLSGAFLCNNKIKKLNIEVTSPYKVLESNGKKNGNTYSWSIKKKDFSNVDVSYKISRDYKKMSQVSTNIRNRDKRNNTIRNLRIAVIVVMVLVIIGFSIRFYFMKKESVY